MATVADTPRLPEPTRGPGPIKLREAVLADHAQIARLEARFGLTPKDYEAWSHLWLGNPLYPTLRADWSIGWVLEADGGRIVGSMANIPLPYEFDGRPLLAASGRHWVAEPAYRGAALMLLDRVINQPGVDLYINNTVTAASEAAVTAFDCARVPVGQWDRSGRWFTHRRRYYETRLRHRRWPLAGPLSYALSVPASFKDWLRTKPLGGADVKVSGCAGFDDRFDEFWTALKARAAHRLLAVRSREVLHWHYRHALLNGDAWIAVIPDGARLAAYATFQRDARPAWGTRMRLVDFQSRDGGAALLRPLIGWALRKCRQSGIHVLEVVGRWLGAGEPLEKAAPQPRALPAWKFVYRANAPALAVSLGRPEAWDPSMYDGDASL